MTICVNLIILRVAVKFGTFFSSFLDTMTERMSFRLIGFPFICSNHSTTILLLHFSYTVHFLLFLFATKLPPAVILYRCCLNRNKRRWKRMISRIKDLSYWRIHSITTIDWSWSLLPIPLFKQECILWSSRQDAASSTTAVPLIWRCVSNDSASSACWRWTCNSVALKGWLRSVEKLDSIVAL